MSAYIDAVREPALTTFFNTRDLNLTAPHFSWGRRYFYQVRTDNRDGTVDHRTSRTVFQICAQYGLIEHLRVISSEVESNILREAIKENSYLAIHEAANGLNHITLAWLLEQLSNAEDKQAVIRSRNYRLVRWAVENALWKKLLKFFSYLPEIEDKKTAIWASEDTDTASTLIQAVAAKGNETVVNKLFAYLTTPKEKIEAIKTANFALVRSAAHSGLKNTLKYCLDMLETGHDKATAIKAFGYKVIKEIAKTGDEEIVNEVLRHLSLPEERKAAIRVLTHTLIATAARNNNYEVLESSIANLSTPEDKVEATKDNEYHALCFTAKNGYLETFQKLFQLLPAQEQQIALHQQGYKILRTAVQFGHTDVARYLLNMQPTDIDKIPIIARSSNFYDGGYSLVQDAAGIGDLATLEYLLEVDPSSKGRKDLAHQVISHANKIGGIHILNKLLNYLPTEADKLRVIEANDFSVIYKAARYGDSQQLTSLFSLLQTSSDIPHLIASNSYKMIREALVSGDTSCFEWLMSQLPTASDKNTAITSYDPYKGNLVVQAAQSSDIALLKLVTSYLLTDADKKIAISYDNHLAIRAASESGKKEFVEHLLNCLPCDLDRTMAVKATGKISFYDEATEYAPIIQAATQHHWELYSFLMSFLINAEDKVAVIKSQRYAVIHAAIKAGDLPAVKQFFEQLPVTDRATPVTGDLILCAVNNRDLELVKYLLQILPTRNARYQVVTSSDYILCAAFDRNNLECFEYLLDQLTSSEAKKENILGGAESAIIQERDLDLLTRLLTQPLIKQSLLTVIKENNFSFVRLSFCSGIDYFFDFFLALLTDSKDKKAAIQSIISCSDNDNLVARTPISSISEKGQYRFIERFFNTLTPREIKTAIKAHSFASIRHAAYASEWGIVIFLLEKLISKKDRKSALKADDNFVIHCAVKCKDTFLLDRLLTYLPSSSDKTSMVRDNNYNLLSTVISSASINMLDYINQFLKTTQDKASITIQLKAAIENNHHSYLGIKWNKGSFKRYLNYLPSEQDKKLVIKQKGYHFFHKAIEKGDIPAVITMLSILSTDEEKKAAIIADHCTAIRCAALSGDENFFTILLGYIDDATGIEDIITYDDCDIVDKIFTSGHVYLFPILFSRVRTVDENNNINLVVTKVITRIARSPGWSPKGTIDYILDQYSTERRTLFIRRLYEQVVWFEKISTVQNIFQLLSDQGEPIDHIRADDYRLINWSAASNTNQYVLEWIIQRLPTQEERGAALRIDYGHSVLDYPAITESANNNRWDNVHYLLNQLPNYSEKMDAIASNEYRIVRMAMNQRNEGALTYLLSFPNVLGYIEQAQSDYCELPLQSWITNFLNDVERYRTQTPQPTLINHDCQRCFYIIRYSIRRLADANEFLKQELLDRINTLLSIPEVAALAHHNLRPNERDREDNELIRLAVSLHLEDVESRLLLIPQVARLAEASNYYRAQTGRNINLRNLANNRESSMVGFSENEERLIDHVQTHYQVQIDALGGVDGVFSILHQDLYQRYHADQPTFTKTSGEVITLPYGWDDFCALDLSESERSEASKIYYQDKRHTAYRFLSKPNPFIATNFYSHIEGNAAQHMGYARFEEFKPIIAAFYVAAKDPDLPTNLGSIEDRVFLFICNGLAASGRAHNWDETRSIRNINGSEATEEYDDLEGDKPSCDGGMKQRFFGSMKWHPLFNLLTVRDIQDHWFESVRAYLQTRINAKNATMLRQIYAKSCKLDQLTSEEQQCKDAIELPGDFKNIFFKEMAHRYGSSFKHETWLDRWIQSQNQHICIANGVFLCYHEKLHLGELIDKVEAQRMYNIQLLCGCIVALGLALVTIAIIICTQGLASIIGVGMVAWLASIGVGEVITVGATLTLGAGLTVAGGIGFFRNYPTTPNNDVPPVDAPVLA